MGRYRKVDVRIWNDARFGKLSDDGKLAFLFILTHPHLTGLGCMRATGPGLAAELGWTAERFAAAISELVSTGNDEWALVEYDEQAAFVGLPNFHKYNQPENPNVVTGWGGLLDLLPECPARKRLIDRIDLCVRERGEKFLAAWETVCQTVPERFGNDMPNQEQEQEQEQKQKQKDSADAAGVLKKSKEGTSKNQEPVQIPPELDTDAGRKALDEWRTYRRQIKKKLNRLSEEKLLAEWSSKGSDRFAKAVDHSIANGWQGLFEPNSKRNQPQAEMHSGIQAWLSEESDSDETTLPIGIDPGSILAVQQCPAPISRLAWPFWKLDIQGPGNSISNNWTSGSTIYPT